MLHDILISLHSLSATLCFGAGVGLLMPHTLASGSRPRLMLLYLVSLASMAAFLSGAMLTGWQTYGRVERPVFTLLLGLAVYMLFRAWQANIVRRQHQAGWQDHFINHMGFNLIALFEGFIIVTAINLGASPLFVAALAILAVIVGNMALHRLHFSVKKLVV